MKKEKGSVTLFVLISCMFMVVILLVVNIGVMNKNRSQEKNLEEISKQYNQNETDLDGTYSEVVENEGYVKKSELNKILYYNPGDTYNAPLVSTAGYVIDSSTQYRFSIYLAKNISNDVNSIEAMCESVYIVQNGKYILGELNEPATKGFSIAVNGKQGENILNIIVSVEKANSATINREACGVIINGLTLNFN